MTGRFSTEAEQATAEELGEQIRALVLPYILQHTPPDIDAPTLTMNVAVAAVQTLGLAEVDHGGRLSFVEGVGYALGLIHAQYAEHGVGAISAATEKGFARGARDGAAALKPAGAA